MNLISVIRRINTFFENYFVSQGYTLQEEYSQKLFRVEIEDNSDEKYSDIYIYSELSPEEFFTISSELNAIVEKFDSSAYFDLVEPGVFQSRIYWDSAENSDFNSTYSISSKDLRNFGEQVCVALEDVADKEFELIEDFWVDNIGYDIDSSELIIEISSNNYTGNANIHLYNEDIFNYNDLIDVALNRTVEFFVNELLEA